MEVLGFRSDPKASRYAVTSKHNDKFILKNADSDSKLSLPASIEENDVSRRMEWVYREILAIFDTYPNITKVVIKQNEFTKTDTKAKRWSTFSDAAVALACAHKNISVELKTYGSIGTTRKETKKHAETRIGRTVKYWDDKMADAVNAAWLGFRNNEPTRSD